MPWMLVDEVAAASLLGRGRELDVNEVQQYRERIDDLLPIVIFETDEGLLLVDGHHRLAAAVAEGREQIEVEVRQGSRSDALTYAAKTGAAQLGIPVEQAWRQILEEYGPLD